MKSQLFLLLVLAVCLAGPASRATAQSQRVDMAVLEFPEKAKILGVTLLGKYVFIHDDQKKADGKECLYIYEYNGDASTPVGSRLGKQVLAFHCQTVERSKVKLDVLTLTATKEPGVLEIKEIQFAGSDKGHRVPSE
jgi:hypothetical protein